MNQAIRILEEQIKIEKLKISKCDHDFHQHFHNLETITCEDPWNDPFWTTEGKYEMKKERWTRICKNCGLEQHTYTLKPIITGYEPIFKN